MPYSHYRPELMGSATLEPSAPVEAGSYQSFTLVYAAGPFGVDDTGSIKIGFRFATDFGPVQFDDPKAPGYTTVEASNGATLETRWEFKRNIRPWSRSLYIGVMKHFLKPGDTITIRFGDRRQGSPGIRMQTFCENEFEFRVLTDVIATYDYVALPESPQIAILPGPGIDWHAVMPTLVRTGAVFRLGIKANDAWGNPSDLMHQTLHLAVEGAAVSGLPATLAFRKGEFAAVADGLTLPEPGEAVVAVRDEAGNLLCRSNPIRAIADPNKQALVHFWGDTHGQSNETLGTNDARDYMLFGRDRAFLDVMGHQGNDFQITGSFWKELNALTAELDRPGEFVCIPGYEWSANTAVGGDRNVHYRREGEAIHRSSHAQIADPGDMVDEASDAHTAHDLFDKLTGKDCVVMAHVGGRYADITFAHDNDLETAVEVHSDWGTFEWIVWDALEKGYRVGIVGNSDGHKGRPGASYPGASFFGSQGGLTCFLAPRLDRDAIFQSMRRRRHYATTGNRMLLDVRITTQSEADVELPNQAGGSDAPPPRTPTRRLIMGDIAHVTDTKVTLDVGVVGSAAIERLDIFRGREMIDTIRPYSPDQLGKRLRITFEGAEYRGRARTTVWDGSMKVTGNTIAQATMFNNWNIDRGIRSQSQDEVRWKAVTTGNYCGIDLWLDDAASGAISIDTPHARASLDISAVGLEETVFEAGGLERKIKVYRLPDAPAQERLQHTMKIQLNQTGDTPVFVRVTQIDGHRAWSSPIYLVPK
ncbi:MAG: DUF3604 domain-containing protein [Alphaproteobacteria bacterium]|nr:DUF3604 domain-containing protein [Alphaproteobacteria bacterium]